jgi:uncharacterized DUF497 family protein
MSSDDPGPATPSQSELEHYEADPDKSAANERKHGVSFNEADTALDDDYAVAYEDGHSEGEPRWRLIGMSARGRLLRVSYTLREDDKQRIISAREAESTDEREYARYRR